MKSKKKIKFLPFTLNPLRFTLGFTLIELLVVIAIIALIIAVSLPNFLGARERSRDVKKKAELRELKTALRLYYNDYGHYPSQSAGAMKTLTGMLGCGTNGTSACPVCTSADFAAGGSDGCSAVYMKKFPSYTQTLFYFSDGADNYRLAITLENPSDADLAASQARCPSALSASCTGSTYCVCPE